MTISKEMNLGGKRLPYRIPLRADFIHTMFCGSVISSWAYGTSYSTRPILSDNALAIVQNTVLFDVPMLRNIRKCSVEEGRRQCGGQAWDLALFELEKFIGLVVARSVIEDASSL